MTALPAEFDGDPLLLSDLHVCLLGQATYSPHICGACIKGYTVLYDPLPAAPLTSQEDCCTRERQNVMLERSFALLGQ